MDNYVLCSRDCESNKLVYYTGQESFYGGSVYSDVLSAKRFKSLQEVADFIKNHRDECYLGINIINIADVTFEALKTSYDGDKDLYYKYHDVNYAIR